MCWCLPSPDGSGNPFGLPAAQRREIFNVAQRNSKRLQRTAGIAPKNNTQKYSKYTGRKNDFVGLAQTLKITLTQN